MMKIFSWVTKDTTFDFMKHRKITYVLSVVLLVLSMAVMAVKGFNYGIDFSGGILVEIKSEKAIDLDELREEVASTPLKDIQLQTIGELGDEVIIRAQPSDSNLSEQKIVDEVKEVLGGEYEFRKIEMVGPQVGDELKRDGVIAAVLSVIAISIYVWVRFEWQFALGAMVGLVHDIIIVMGLLSLCGVDFNLTTVAAILTFAGYSVNDTVVTYDRIREYLKKYKKMPQYDLINKSINDILSRTILTGLTTLLASLSLYMFGGEILSAFAFPLVWGILIGTYSSIYISGIMLNLFDLRKNQEEKNYNPFGKVD